MKKREKGICPTCRRLIAQKKGSGPYADGRGHVMDHRNHGLWCMGGFALAALKKGE